ncbi:MAG: pseudouridine synthase [Candidatus Rokubacteria bacterium RIFCSPHIGHO2_12_FULL_73_22]|nr:MAG: pseudouridine synthase [Candidatus Rokubacteria bacterium RIFCSPHIGHO2_02_FULL_73_26]OGL00557.1 MAG: pseudouridine synthase [Candidatus Rokubacteria bacterium RIFCSPHIGHO2_12_FULL_73_22]OGL08263.1 MAG: pseudouridine synthase [Candidatus Rokubacteria bacterium RIFCSPLOWO2_02_FULL_73_56]OGL28646.1 MAG: pseudouridine synthase [Candidatus Rokubacteria bacterium RIFCSPLOWO2_12_FULL_73_47]
MAELTVDPGAAGTRLDRWLSARLPELSRARLQVLIAAGRVRVGGRAVKASHRLRGGERVEVEVPPPAPEELVPEPAALAIVHEDAHVLVVDKPAGMVVHPGAGHARGTLAAAVLAHAPTIAGVGGPRRPGIVHRLDKDTSGLLVLAKTREAYEALVAQLASRTVTRRYLVVVHGRVARDAGVVDRPIGRHPHDRVRMAVRPAGRGRRAVTRFRVLERFARFTHLEVSLETGRTHQIRVHLASLGHPVAGDAVYGGRRRPPVPVPLEGLALHAAALAFVHPATGERLEFRAPLPARMERLLSHLRDSG